MATNFSRNDRLRWCSTWSQMYRTVAWTAETNTERAVSFLLFKRVQFWKCVMNPFGGIALEMLQSFRHRECSWQRNQHVNVIGDSADGQRFHFVFSCDTTEVWPESVANIRTQKMARAFSCSRRNE